MTHNIEVQGGKTVKLPTAGKYCDRDILVTAVGYTEADLQAKFDEGVQAEYDRFWDAYQQNGKRTVYDLAFAGIGWNAETFKPKYTIRPTGGSVYQMFARTTLEVIDETVLDFSGVTSTQMAMYNSSYLKSVTIDLSSMTAFSNLFSYDRALETVMLKNVPETCNFTGGFESCSQLTSFTVTGIIGGTHLNLQWSTKLSAASIVSVINALSATVTDASLTLSQTAVEAAFTDEDWAALIADRTNWTINLV